MNENGHIFNIDNVSPLVCNKYKLEFEWYYIYLRNEFRIYYTNKYLTLICDEYIIKSIIE